MDTLLEGRATGAVRLLLATHGKHLPLSRLQKERQALSDIEREAEKALWKGEADPNNRGDGRDAFTRVQNILDEGFKFLNKASAEDDMSDEDCDDLLVGDQLYSHMRDEDMIEQIEKAKSPPYSFEPDMWRGEYERECATNKVLSHCDLSEQGWKALYSTRWNTHAEHLTKWLLDQNYNPPRKTKTNESGLNAKTMKRFHEIKRSTRLNKHTGQLHFVANVEPPNVPGDIGAKVWSQRRVCTDYDKMRAIFRAYWHDPNVGGFKKAGKLHKRLRQDFLGLPRNQLEALISHTTLDQVQRSGNTFQKVTNPIETSAPMEHWQMDLMNLPRSIDGYEHVLVVIDLFSKFIWTAALRNKKPETVVKKMEKIFLRCGVPVVLQSDNGSEFIGTVAVNAWHYWGTIHRTSRAYKPTSQGQVERVNREFKQAWAQDTIMLGMKANWKESLNRHTWRINTTVWESTGFTPWKVHMGYEMNWMPHPDDNARKKLMDLMADSGFVQQIREANKGIPEEELMRSIRYAAADELTMLDLWNRSIDPAKKLTIKPPPLWLTQSASGPSHQITAPPQPIAESYVDPAKAAAPTPAIEDDSGKKLKYVGPKSFEAMQASGKRKREFKTGLSGDPTVKAVKHPDQPLCYAIHHQEATEDGGEGCDEQQAFELDGKTFDEAAKTKRLKIKADAGPPKGKVTKARVEQLMKRGLLVLE